MPKFSVISYSLHIQIIVENLFIFSDDGYGCNTPTFFSHFKSKILAAIEEITEKKRRPAIDAIYEHIMKSEASNAGKNLIEMIIAELTKENVIVDKKTFHGLNFFYKSSTAKQSTDFTITKPSPPKSNSTANWKLTTRQINSTTKIKQMLMPIMPRTFKESINMNTSLAETFFENQRGINVSQLKRT